MKHYLFGKYILQIPDDHKIRDIHKQDILYDRLFGSILEAISADNPQGVFIDIGANIGDTAAFFSTYISNPIVSVEGSQIFLDYLRRNQRQLEPQVSIVERFVRVKALERYRLIYEADRGTGFLRVAADHEAHVNDIEFIGMAELINIALSKGSELALVKSDTDGLDGFLMLDAMDEAPNTPLFFECDTVHTLVSVASPWPEVFQKLRERAYSVVIFDNVGLPMAISSRPEEVLRDLSGWIHTQHSVERVRVHYLDVWAFPENKRTLFETISDTLRGSFLMPFGF